MFKHYCTAYLVALTLCSSAYAAQPEVSKPQAGCSFNPEDQYRDTDGSDGQQAFAANFMSMFYCIPNAEIKTRLSPKNDTPDTVMVIAEGKEQACHIAVGRIAEARYGMSSIQCDKVAQN